MKDDKNKKPMQSSEKASILSALVEEQYQKESFFKASVRTQIKSASKGRNIILVNKPS